MATRIYTWSTSANGTAGTKWGGVWTIPSASKIWLFGANTPTGDLHYAGKITHIKLEVFLGTGAGLHTWRGYVVGNGGYTVVDGSWSETSHFSWGVGSHTLIDKDVNLDGLTFLDKNKLLGVCITFTGTTTDDTVLNGSQYGMARLIITYTPASIIGYRVGNNWQLVKPYYYVNGNWVNCKAKYYVNGSWIDIAHSLS